MRLAVVLPVAGRRLLAVALAGTTAPDQHLVIGVITWLAAGGGAGRCSSYAGALARAASLGLAAGWRSPA